MLLLTGPTEDISNISSSKHVTDCTQELISMPSQEKMPELLKSQGLGYLIPDTTIVSWMGGKNLKPQGVTMGVRLAYMEYAEKNTNSQTNDHSLSNKAKSAFTWISQIGKQLQPPIDVEKDEKKLTDFLLKDHRHCLEQITPMVIK